MARFSFGWAALAVHLLGHAAWLTAPAIADAPASVVPSPIDNDRPYSAGESGASAGDEAPPFDNSENSSPPQSPPNSFQPPPNQPWFPDESVFRAIEVDLATRSDWEPGQGYISRQIFQTWSDSCMDLAAASEVCADIAFEGWHIEIGLGSRQRAYIYHTDLTGAVIRYFDPSTDRPVAGALILAAAAAEQSLAIEDLALQAIEPYFFSPCSGVINLQAPCDQAGYLGWRTVVTDGTRQWVYTTGPEGNLVWQAGASLTTAVYEPVFQFHDAVFDLGRVKTVFQTVYVSGVAGGGSVVATLLEDGHFERRLIYPDGSYEVIGQRVLSEAALAEFLAVLDTVGFANFYGLDYWAPDGAEQYNTYQLNDHQGFVYFDDHSFADLPPALQSVMTAWEALIHPAGL